MSCQAHTHISDRDYDCNKTVSRKVTGFVENGTDIRKGRKAALMNKDMVRGKLNQVKGRVNEKAGKATGDKSREIGGKTERLAGKVQEEYGKLKQNIKEATEA